MNGRPGADSGTRAGPIREAEAVEHVVGICFKHGPPRKVGVELEWLLHDAHDPSRPVSADRLVQAYAGAEQVPLTGRLTREPGGQWELSTLPAATIDDCFTAADRDIGRLSAAAADAGLRLTGLGAEPHRLPPRTLDLPRYAAMEEFFDRTGHWGRIMMCGTASVQVNLDAGLEGSGPLGHRERWDLLHALGPVLVAAFANSPLLDGRPSGWRSTRQAVWAQLDPSRTLAPHPTADDEDLRETWAAYALDAELLCVRRPGGSWTAPAGVTFRDWLRTGGPDAPTLADLDYHLSTLFPPVRPRGHLELRVIDAQQGDDWRVPVALVTALLDDPVAADAARAVLEPLTGQYPPDASGSGENRPGAGPRSARPRTASTTRPAPGRPGLFDPRAASGAERGPRGSLWLRAARLGLTDPALRRAAEECFALAAGALPRLGAPGRVTEVVTAYAERYVLRGRCPADDQLDALGGPAVPTTIARREASLIEETSCS